MTLIWNSRQFFCLSNNWTCLDTTMSVTYKIDRSYLEAKSKASFKIMNCTIVILPCVHKQSHTLRGYFLNVILSLLLGVQRIYPAVKNTRMAFNFLSILQSLFFTWKTSTKQSKFFRKKRNPSAQLKAV